LQRNKDGLEVIELDGSLGLWQLQIIYMRLAAETALADIISSVSLWYQRGFQ
jgi:hypothetical protein